MTVIMLHVCCRLFTDGSHMTRFIQCSRQHTPDKIYSETFKRRMLLFVASPRPPGSGSVHPPSYIDMFPPQSPGTDSNNNVGHPCKTVVYYKAVEVLLKTVVNIFDINSRFFSVMIWITHVFLRFVLVSSSLSRGLDFQFYVFYFLFFIFCVLKSLNIFVT